MTHPATIVTLPLLPLRHFAAYTRRLALTSRAGASSPLPPDAGGDTSVNINWRKSDENRRISRLLRTFILHLCCRRARRSARATIFVRVRVAVDRL